MPQPNTSDPLTDPSASQYQPKSQIEVPPSQHAGPHGVIPFTGQDAGALGFIAVVAIVVGIVLHRASAPRPSGR